MTSKIVIALALITTVSINSSQLNKVSTLAGVCLTGAVLKSSNSNISVKYKRKDCPVCKGKGWYISGDGIAKVDCGYCEPEKGINQTEIIRD